MTEKDLELLLSRYYEGTTTPADEEALRRYFRRPAADIPPRWREEQAYFRALDEARPADVPPEVSRRIEGMLDRLGEVEAPADLSPNPAKPAASRSSRGDLHRIRLRLMLWTGSIAACLILGLSFGRKYFDPNFQPATQPTARTEFPAQNPLPAPGQAPAPATKAQSIPPTAPVHSLSTPARSASTPTPRPTAEELALAREGLQLYAEAMQEYEESLADVRQTIRQTEAELQASVRQVHALCATTEEEQQTTLAECRKYEQETQQKLKTIIQQLNP